jgi:glycosyltransferase involved in cell wall biosynthesis
MTLDAADGLSGGTGAPSPDRLLRIVHCFRSPVGGLFRHVADLTREQARNGHSVGIVCDSSTGGEYEERLFDRLTPSLALGLKRVPMERQISPSDLAASWRLMREIRSLNPDVLHAHGAKGGVYARVIGALLRVSGTSVARIYTPHGGSLHYDPHTLGGRVYFNTERFLELLTEALIFVSGYEANAYRVKVGPPRRPVTLARNGLRPEEFEPITPDPDAVDFLYIGMLRDLKGTDVFIESLAEIGRREGTAPRALIVGDGPDKAKYHEAVRALGLAETTRFHDPMPARDAFRKARVVVVPSRAESMPYIVLETIGAGVPLIATRVGGIPEIYGPHSEQLIAPSDVAALADAMLAAAKNPAETQAKADALRSYIQPLFSIEAMARTIAGAYREVAR